MAAICEVEIGRRTLGRSCYRCGADVAAIPRSRAGALTLTEGVEDGPILQAKGEYDVLFLIVSI